MLEIIQIWLKAIESNHPDLVENQKISHLVGTQMLEIIQIW